MQVPAVICFRFCSQEFWALHSLPKRRSGISKRRFYGGYIQQRRMIPLRMSVDAQLGASFRDPSGFVYRRDGVLLRQVNASYEGHLRLLNESGLYRELTSQQLLIPHSEVGLELALNGDAVAVLLPELIRTISYPYEWCFSQLKDAALATLKVQAVRAQSRNDVEGCERIQHPVLGWPACSNRQPVV